MSIGAEIRDFLLARRGRIPPERAGFPAHGDRRVTGLRREEVAQPAGVSVEYCARLERNVAFRRSGVKRFQHPVVGALTVTFESLTLVTDPDLRLTAGTADPGSPSESALQMLAHWTSEGQS